MFKLNYRHLYYFWVVAKEGSVTRAAEKLGVAVQTISMQLNVLEKSIGKALFSVQGRRLILTEAGHTALGYAEKIFMMGNELCETLNKEDIQAKALRLKVGISDSLPKIVAYRILEPVLQMDQFVCMECYDGGFENLLADLALHKLDVVLTDRPATVSGNLKVYSHQLGRLPIGLFAVSALAKKYIADFPKSLDGAPILLPTKNNIIRIELDLWFEQNNIKPFVAGEFSDSALLKTFGRNGLGMFHAPLDMAKEFKEQLNAEPVGEINGVYEQYFAIVANAKIHHRAVNEILKGLKPSTVKA